MDLPIMTISAGISILETSFELRRLLDRSKHQPALKRAACHRAVVKELAAKALGSLDSDNLPDHISQANFNERQQAWVEYQDDYNKLMSIMEPMKRSKYGRLRTIRTIFINIQWRIVRQLVKDMDRQKAVLENAVNADRIELLSDHYREIHEFISKISPPESESTTLNKPNDDENENVEKGKDTISQTSSPGDPGDPPNGSPQDEAVSDGQDPSSKTTEEIQVIVHKRFRKSQDFQLPEPNRLLRRASSLPKFPNDRIATSSIQIHNQPIFGSAHPTESATKELGATALENIAAAVGSGASSAGSVIPESAVKVAAGVGFGGLGISAINAIISAHNSHINYKNSKIAKQIANAGDQNVEAAKIVAEAEMQNAIAAKIAADAAALTAKIAAEKWEREKKEEGANSSAKDKSLSREEFPKSNKNKKSNTGNDDSSGTGLSGDEDSTASIIKRTPPALNTLPKQQQKQLPLVSVRSAPQSHQSSHRSAPVSTSLTSSAQIETLDGINKILDEIKAKKASRAMPLLGTNTRRFEAILTIEKERERTLNLNLASLRENLSTSSSALPESLLETTSHKSVTNNMSVEEIITTTDNFHDNEHNMAKGELESQGSRTDDNNPSPPSEIDPEYNGDFDAIENNTTDIPLQKLNPDHHQSLGIGAEPTSVLTAAPYQVYGYGGRDAVSGVRKGESDTTPDNRIPRSAIPSIEGDHINHIEIKSGGNVYQDKSEDAQNE